MSIRRLLLVVRGSRGELACLSYESESRFGFIDGLLLSETSLDVTQLEVGRARVMFRVGTLGPKSKSGSEPLRPTKFEVNVELPHASFALLHFDDWQSTADAVRRLQGFDTAIDVYAFLDRRATWAHAVAALYDAIEFGVDGFGPTLAIDGAGIDLPGRDER